MNSSVSKKKSMYYLSSMHLSVAAEVLQLVLICGLTKFIASLNICLTSVNPVQNLAFGIPPEYNFFEKQEMRLADY